MKSARCIKVSHLHEDDMKLLMFIKAMISHDHMKLKNFIKVGVNHEVLD